MPKPSRYRTHHWGMVFRARWHRVTSGGIFPSAVAALIALSLSVLLHYVESVFGSEICTYSESLLSLCSMSLDMAVSLQAGVALGVLGTVGVVFSILLVSLQLVSGQFSPRLVQAIFRDHRSKTLVALLVGVFVFSMASLFFTVAMSRQVPTAGFTTALVGVAGIIAGVSLVLMLYGVALRQYIGAILDDAAKKTIGILESGRSRRRKQIAEDQCVVPLSTLKDYRMFPEELGTAFIVTAADSGWVQQLATHSLMKVVPRNCVIRLETRIGAFVPSGAALASVWPIISRSDRSPLTEEEKERLISEVNLSTYLGGARTLQDDADFGLRQITDVYMKSMSPAVNDPSTAIEALMRTTTILRTIIATPLPRQIDQNVERGLVMLQPWNLDSGEFMRHGLDQVRQEATKDPAVAIAVLRTITHLLEAAVEAEQRIEKLTNVTEQTERRQHIALAREELLSQREAFFEKLESTDFAAKDYAYVLRGSMTQRDDLRPSEPT